MTYTHILRHGLMALLCFVLASCQATLQPTRSFSEVQQSAMKRMAQQLVLAQAEARRWGRYAAEAGRLIRKVHDTARALHVPAAMSISLHSITPDWMGETRKPTRWSSERELSSRERKTEAKRGQTEAVKALFQEAGVSFPPKRVILVAYKLEREFEVWASDTLRGEMTRVATYGICSASGQLGPKRYEGDGQVPEGFYKIDYFNSGSAFHLALHVSYPNRSDRILTTHPDSPGSAIMVHGDCVSVGCLAMSDERMNEIWLMVRAAYKERKRDAPMYIFPARDIQALLPHADPELAAFWMNLHEGHERFEQTRDKLDFKIDASGRYVFE